MPSAVTPNEDGINDVFSISTQGIEYFEIFIFNRWGEVMIHSNDPSEYWDGKHKGILAEDGNYVYKITAKSQNGLTKKFNGHFRIVR